MWVLSSAMGLTVSLRRATCSLWKQHPGLFGDSRVTLLLRSSVIGNPNLVLEVSLVGDKRRPTGTLFPPLFGDFLLFFLDGTKDDGNNNLHMGISFTFFIYVYTLDFC